jgi:hypothetical protein
LGLAGLKDAARSGKPATVTASQKAMVIQKACEKPDGGYTNWSQRRIGQQVGISQTKVHQILKKADLKPHKTEYCCGKSPDPEFEQKMFNIVGLYMNPPENVIVDNLAIHKYKKVKEWLAGKRKIKLHFTPTYCSWLNQVEIFFNMLSKDVLKGGVWKSVEQLSAQLIEYIKIYNQTRAKPFAWTYTGNLISVS